MATAFSATIVPPKFPVAGVRVSRTNYAEATRSIIDAARHRRPFVAAATSVHGVALAVRREDFRAALNSFDMVTPDGQPVRWALNLIHGTRLPERVYGPTLMLRVCEAAADAGLSVYFCGGQPEVLGKLARRMRQRLPHLSIAGTHSPPFRPLSAAEQDAASARDQRLACEHRLCRSGMSAPGDSGPTSTAMNSAYPSCAWAPHSTSTPGRCARRRRGCKPVVWSGYFVSGWSRAACGAGMPNIFPSSWQLFRRSSSRTA